MGIMRWAFDKLNSTDQVGVTKAAAAGRMRICPPCKGEARVVAYVDFSGKMYWKDDGKWWACTHRRTH